MIAQQGFQNISPQQLAVSLMGQKQLSLPSVQRASRAQDFSGLTSGIGGLTSLFAPKKKEKGLLSKLFRSSSDIGLMGGLGLLGSNPLLGAGLLAFSNAKLRPGIDLVAGAIRLPMRLSGCDLVITGEGRTDGQTLHGKAPMGVVREARKQGIPVIVISGSVGPGAEALLGEGV